MEAERLAAERLAEAEGLQLLTSKALSGYKHVQYDARQNVEVQYRAFYQGTCLGKFATGIAAAVCVARHLKELRSGEAGAYGGS